MGGFGYISLNLNGSGWNLVYLEYISEGSRCAVQTVHSHKNRGNRPRDSTCGCQNVFCLFCNQNNADIRPHRLIGNPSLPMANHPKRGVVSVTWPILNFLGRNHTPETSEAKVVKVCVLVGFIVPCVSSLCRLHTPNVRGPISHLSDRLNPIFFNFWGVNHISEKDEARRFKFVLNETEKY